MHPDLKYAGVLPPLDAPHHLRSTEWGPYREGVVRQADASSGSLLDVGLQLDAHIPQVRACLLRLRLTGQAGPACPHLVPLQRATLAAVACRCCQWARA